MSVMHDPSKFAICQTCRQKDWKQEMEFKHIGDNDQLVYFHRELCEEYDDDEDDE